MVNKKEPRENKDKRIVEAIERLEVGEFASLTDLEEESGVRDVTISERLDTYDTLRSVEFDTSRFKRGKKKDRIRGVIRTEGENLNIQEELKKINRRLKELKDTNKQNIAQNINTITGIERE